MRIAVILHKMRELIDVQENAQENMLRGNLQDKSQEDAVEKKVDFSCNCSWDKDGEGGIRSKVHAGKNL